ncbi:cysteine desulfurase family protein [Marinicrinis sediminis]|uniref:Cysteine desulfurase family protein n=1 Tax=Marinicrinis sediminis TaxID=1652465 RepID=A0ABW5RBG2_9BACL
MIYLDHAATTPPYPEVVQVMGEVMQKYTGNPSSLHHLGMEAERLLHKSRAVIAGLLKVKDEQVIFTSSGSESNNLAIKGAALRYQNRGKHLITTQIEHACVYESFRQLEHWGFDVTYIAPDATGRVQVKDVLDAIRDDTILVSVMHVNNETGRIQPVSEIGRKLRSFKKILFHVDAVQSIGKFPFSLSDLHADFISLSAHKFGGPRGAGMLIKPGNLELVPLIHGGGQEFGLRSGTENLPAIVGMAKALRMTLDHLDQKEARVRQLQAQLVEGLAGQAGLVLNGSYGQQEAAPHIVNFSFPGMKSEVFLHALERHHLYISTRSACASGESKPSRILESMGVGRARATSGLRISLAPTHTEADIQTLLGRISDTVRELQAHISK